MTENELHIQEVMNRLLKWELTEQESSKLIRKSVRQTQRIKKKYKHEWTEWLIHKLRWKKSNHKYDETVYTEAVQIIKKNYSDYWPTLVCEKLSDIHKIHISIPIIRREMIRHGLWKAKARRKEEKQYTARERRASAWELIQYDGSYHKWFEERDGTWYQCLLVSVDDATGEVTAKFALNEGLTETYIFWKEYILERWKPLAIYLDKFATYKVNYPTATDDKELPTQFWRASKELWIELIFANSPQAKGRVERMNQTLQDRLVKELRENNISDIVSANKFLREVFLPKFNKKFMVIPRNTSNLHTPLRADEISKLDQIFSAHSKRRVANDYTIKFKNKCYQLYKSEEKTYNLRPKQEVCVETHLNWEIKVSIRWTYVNHKESFERPEKQNINWAPRMKWVVSDTPTQNEHNTSVRDQKEKEAKAYTLAWEKEDHYYLIT